MDPQGTPTSEDHKLKIRKRAKTKRKILNKSDGGQESIQSKQAQREFLKLLEHLPNDLERAVAFMGVASIDARIHLNTVMKKAPTEEFRLRILDFLDKLDVAICENLLRVLNPLSGELMVDLFNLQFEIDWDRYMMTLALAQETLTKFITIMFDMSAEDRERVIKTSFECNMTMEMFLGLLITTADEPKCPICTARRKIGKEVVRINNLIDPKAAAKFSRPTSIYENELVEKRDFILNPTTDFYSISFDEEAKKTTIFFSDASGQAIASKEHVVDTKIICNSCKEEVYTFALRAGNDLEMWHALWQSRLDLLEQARKLDVEKSRWWVEEKRNMEFVETVKAIIRAKKNTKQRKRDLKKRQEQEERKRKQKEAEDLKKIIFKNMIRDAVETDGKWMQQELKSQGKSLNTRNLAASLEFETAYGLHERSRKERKNARSTSLKEYHPDSGIPLTAEAASEAFGTNPIVVKDESKELNQWKFQLQEAKKKLDWRRDEQERQREAAEKANFEENMDRWLEDAQEVKDKIEAKYQRQQWLRQQKIDKRNGRKRLDKILRDKMHKEAEMRRAEDARQELERQHRLAEEEHRQQAERHKMALNEADQRGVDRFWGIPTAKEKERRLEEMRRRLFEARIKDKRAMMVAVGGEISVAKDVALSVPETLGLPQYRIKTLMISGKELSDDPLGKRRRPVGQR